MNVLFETLGEKLIANEHLKQEKFSFQIKVARLMYETASLYQCINTISSALLLNIGILLLMMTDHDNREDHETILVLIKIIITSDKWKNFISAMSTEDMNCCLCILNISKDEAKYRLFVACKFLNQKKKQDKLFFAFIKKNFATTILSIL